MKKFFLILLLLVVLVGGGVFYAIHKYASVETVAALIRETVKDETGRDISFLRIRIMPYPNLDLVVRLQDVTFGNASWAREKNMAELGELDLRIALRPLLDKRIEVTKFLLDRPVINLEVAEDGRRNWEFLKKKGAAPAARPQEKQGGKGGAVGEFARDVSFKFSQVEIKKGQFSYADRKANVGALLDKVDITVTWPDFDSAVQVDGWAEYEHRRVNLFAALDKPRAFAEGKPSPGKLNLKTDGLFSVSAAGDFATSGTMLSGKVDAKVDALPEFAAWYGGGDAQKLPFTKVAFTSDTGFSLRQLQLKNAKLTLDEVEAAGDVTLGLAGPKPVFRARMALGKLDLDRFTGGKKDGAGGAGRGAQGGGPQEDWDDTPLSFSGLKAVDADLVLRTQGFSLRGADVGPSTLTVLLKGGSLSFKSTEASLFGGKFLSQLTVNAAQATPSFAFRFGMDGVEAKPVLTTFADFDNLSGKADAMVSVTSAGRSQKAIIGALRGDGSFTFRNGSIRGIDLVDIMTKIQSRLAEMGVGEGKTDFVDLTGTFTVNNGVAQNSDLKLRGPLVQATGAGSVDLPRKWVNYRAMPVLTASSGVEGAKGLTVPVDIRGPFHNIKVKPDYKSVVTNIFENPEDAKAAAKNVKENFKGIKEEIRKDPAAAIENLLGGGLFGKKKQPRQEPQQEEALPPEEGQEAPAAP